MKVVVQRVLKANCVVNSEVVSEINYGLMLLVGFTKGDNIDNIKKMVKKIINLRIFEDELGKMNVSIHHINGDILSISQFTLYSNPYSGNRPSFVDALDAENASILYNAFNEELSKCLGKVVKCGVFGADMKLNITCDGPVTITIEY